MQRKIRSVYLNKYMGENKDNDEKSGKNKKDPKGNNSSQPSQSNLDPVVQKLIRDAILIRLVNADDPSHKRDVNELEALVSTCQEFLKSFIILGYDFGGNPVQPIVFAHNQQEADALGNYLSKFINTIIREIKPTSDGG
jgi:hypothetical protein